MNKFTRYTLPLMLALAALAHGAPEPTNDKNPAPAEEQLPEEFKAAWAKRDYVKSLEILQPLAEAGNGKARLIMGFFYEQGWGVEQDFAKAREWFQKAAAAGNALAQRELENLNRY